LPAEATGGSPRTALQNRERGKPVQAESPAASLEENDRLDVSVGSKDALRCAFLIFLSLLLF